jgi:disulfide bond formation protein DsbB
MYPLAVVLLIPRIRRSLPSWLIAVALIGGAVSLYHYGVEHVPALEETSFCAVSNPCSAIWVNKFGFMTIPFMALAGFLAISSLVATGRRWRRTVLAS